jgi:tRNA uridine 5-carboxymethylaminomethyl modification enzyme
LPSFRDFFDQKLLSDSESLEEVEILIKYEGYLEKEQEIANKLSRFEHLEIPNGFDYTALSSLSYEAREKLSKMRPATLGQASRISGVTPADISILIVYFGR